MSQHFLLSSRAKTLTLASVMRMSDEVSRACFRPAPLGHQRREALLSALRLHYCLRKSPQGSFTLAVQGMLQRFLAHVGTLFAFHKMPLRAYLLAIAIFCNEVKGKSMLAMSRDLGVQYKTSFVLAHKMREAMASEVRQSIYRGRGQASRDRWRLFRRLR